MKKRSCRRTQEEITMHELAVKIRKMTDQQLIAYVDEAEARGRRQGVKIFMSSILSKKISGIGEATIRKLTDLAIELRLWDN